MQEAEIARLGAKIAGYERLNMIQQPPTRHTSGESSDHEYSAISAFQNSQNNVNSTRLMLGDFQNTKDRPFVSGQPGQTLMSVSENDELKRSVVRNLEAFYSVMPAEAGHPGNYSQTKTGIYQQASSSRYDQSENNAVTMDKEHPRSVESVERMVNECNQTLSKIPVAVRRLSQMSKVTVSDTQNVSNASKNNNIEESLALRDIVSPS